MSIRAVPNIHPGWVEPTIEMTPSQIEAPQARQVCVNSLEISTSCVADDSRFAELLQVFLSMGCPCYQLAASLPAPRA